MLRKILAGIAGILIANATFIIVRNLTSVIFGMPADIDPNAPATMSAYIASLPIGAFLMILAGYALGSYLGGFSMYKIAKWNSLVLPIVVGVLGTLGWIIDVSLFAYPAWMAVVGMFCFIPFALLGYRSAR